MVGRIRSCWCGQKTRRRPGPVIHVDYPRVARVVDEKGVERLSALICKSVRAKSYGVAGVAGHGNPNAGGSGRLYRTGKGSVRCHGRRWT